MVLVGFLYFLCFGVLNSCLLPHLSLSKLRCPLCSLVTQSGVLGSVCPILLPKHCRWCQVRFCRTVSSALHSVYFRRAWEGGPGRILVCSCRD